ncbi:MAG TPA: metal ABC transporter ATP-binding protein [Verrucomicrobiae bacterium]|nr:metal ABC transporter ATP-binding protein [Verrucomicrobiae bacterium]
MSLNSPASIDPLLRLEDVSAGYARQAVLQNITFNIRRGSFTGLLGANGSGKTTLLKTIAGILQPLAGKIAWGDKARVGYVPQRDVLDPIFLLSSLEVVQMVAGRERSWALECMESTATAELARKAFAQLSGGQKQRVLIARALATRPDFLVLDEPTAGVDPNAGTAIMDLLANIHRSGMTILMVSHDIPLLRRHAEQVAWLHEGKLSTGPASEMLSRDRLLDVFELDQG